MGSHRLLCHFVFIVNATIENLLQDGNNVRIEVGLARESVNNRTGVNFSSRVNGRVRVVLAIDCLWKQKLNVLLVHELSENLNVFVALLDGFVNVNDFCIYHLVSRLATLHAQHGIVPEDHYFVCVIQISLQKRFLL